MFQLASKSSNTSRIFKLFAKGVATDIHRCLLVTPSIAHGAVSEEQRQQAGMLKAVSLSPGSLCCPGPSNVSTHTCCDGGLLILLKLALRPKAWLLSNQSATQIVKYSWQCHFIRVVAVPDSTSLPHISDSTGMAHLGLAQLDKNEYLLENCIERLGAELPPGST